MRSLCCTSQDRNKEIAFFILYNTLQGFNLHHKLINLMRDSLVIQCVYLFVQSLYIYIANTVYIAAEVLLPFNFVFLSVS